MFDVGGAEFLVIILAILLLFGPKSLPDFARQMGKGLRQFRKAQEDLTQQIRDISADAAVREALNTAPGVVVRPPAGGVPVSRTDGSAPADTAADGTPATQAVAEGPDGELAGPDDGPDASIAPSQAPPEPEPKT